MLLYNTLSRKKEDFIPLNGPEVKMYACGVTVYDYTHIGHIRKYVMDDLLKRSLNFLGYKVHHVMNVTDVGHLTGDSDEGTDKLEKGASKQGKTVWEVAEYFTKYFLDTMYALNTLPPEVLCKATEHIPAMITLNQKLVEKGYAYDTPEALYFDISKFPAYGALSGQKIADKQVASREEVVTDPNKRNPADFALWFKRVGRFKDHAMHWDSPWGDGFPGWHVECSAMAMQYLGETIDIHTGGIDHIPVHHENEIAQSEAATGKQFVKYWVHHNFLNIDGTKISKSLNNFTTLDDLKKDGFQPMEVRYFILGSHYRFPADFSLKALKQAQNAYRNLSHHTMQLPSISDQNLDQKYKAYFVKALSDDLNIPMALGVMWDYLKEKNAASPLISEFDSVFGLNLPTHLPKVPDEVDKLAKRRAASKQSGNFKESDSLRQEIEKVGWQVLDGPDGKYSLLPKLN